MKLKKRGKEVKAELSRNCLLCSRYATCSDKRKSAIFACSRFKTNNELDILELFDNLGSKKAIEISHEELLLDEQIELDYVEQIDKILNSGLPAVPDLEYDDRHIPKAKNLFEWITNKNFLGEAVTPYAKQFQLACHAQADWCPSCSNVEFFEDFPLKATVDDIRDNVVFLEYGKCPKCKQIKTDLFDDSSEFSDPFGLIAVVGQRAGKSIITSMNESYNYHKWLVTPSPHRMFGISPVTPLVATYVAFTFAQAKTTLWAPISGYISNSPWFSNYHKWLDEIGRKKGKELYTFSEIMLTYKHKNLLTVVSSPSKRNLRGSTRFTAAIDELGLFPVGKTKAGQDQERADGKEVFTSLENSMLTLRGNYLSLLENGYYNIPKPLITTVSSPMLYNDNIMRLYRLHNGSKEYYCFKSPTWEFNPTMPRKVFNSYYRADPVAAERDYGANPPVSMSAFFKEKDVIPAFEGKSNRIKVSSRKFKSKKKKLLIKGNLDKFFNWESLIQGNCIMAIDAGSNNNSFSFAIGGISAKDETEFRIIALGEVIPSRESPISFRAMSESVLGPLIDAFDIVYLASDRWQNIKLMQDLEEEKDVMYEEYRLKRADFDSYKEDILASDIELPSTEIPIEEISSIVAEDYPQCFFNKPVSHAFYQHITVQDTGNTVVKGEVTDDIFRCCVMLNAMRKWAHVEEEMLTFNSTPSKSVTTIGIVAGAVIGSKINSSSSKVSSIGVRRGLK